MLQQLLLVPGCGALHPSSTLLVTSAAHVPLDILQDSISHYLPTRSPWFLKEEARAEAELLDKWSLTKQSSLQGQGAAT